MKNFVKTVCSLLICILFISCSNNDEIPNPSITIMDGKIVSEYGDFGYIIEAENTELVISGGDRAYIFEWQNQILAL